MIRAQDDEVSRVTVAAVVAAGTVPLDGQSRRPTELFAGPGALERALASGAQLLWMLESSVRPHADALERLLEQLEPHGEEPAGLLAGMVLGASGEPLADRLPAGDERQLEDVLRLAASRLLPIRNAPLAHALVRRELFVDHGLPARARYGPYAGIEWSSRALRHARGYFVPASAVELQEPTGRIAALGSAPALWRMLGAGAWTRGESLAAARRLLGAVLGRPTGDPLPPPRSPVRGSAAGHRAG